MKGYIHDYVYHTQKEYACGDVHENRAECLFSILKPYLRVFRSVSKFNLPGYIVFLQFLRNFRHHNAFEQAELILQAALDPAVASRAKKGEFVTCFDHFDLLQTARNGAFQNARGDYPLRQADLTLDLNETAQSLEGIYNAAPGLHTHRPFTGHVVLKKVSAVE